MTPNPTSFDLNGSGSGSDLLLFAEFCCELEVGVEVPGTRWGGGCIIFPFDFELVGGR